MSMSTHEAIPQPPDDKFGEFGEYVHPGESDDGDDLEGRVPDDLEFDDDPRGYVPNDLDAEAEIGGTAYDDAADLIERDQA
jgi:hypothetical protein